MNYLRILIILLSLLGMAACGGVTSTATPAAPTAASAAPGGATVGALTVSNAWVRQALMPVEAPDPGSSDSMTQTDPMSATSPMSDTAAMTSTGGMGDGTNSAAYMTISSSAGADRLISASSDVASKVELHTVTEEAGVMQMRPVEGIDVPAGGSAELAPGGFHVMLLGIKRDLLPGDSITLELTFEQAGTLTFSVPVQTAPSP